MTATAETTVITCTCTVCNGQQARIRGNGAGITPTKAHNLVRVAHSPLAKAASTVRFGPWAV